MINSIIKIGWWIRSHLPATLNDLITTENNIMAKLSVIKAQVAEANRQSQEALAEILARLDQLVDGATDPDVTDAVFLADLESLRNTVATLANLAPALTDSTDVPGVPQPPVI
jgi:hypothetical protein